MLQKYGCEEGFLQFLKKILNEIKDNPDNLNNFQIQEELKFLDFPSIK